MMVFLVAKQSQALPWSNSELTLGGVRQGFPKIETKNTFPGVWSPRLSPKVVLIFLRRNESENLFGQVDV